MDIVAMCWTRGLSRHGLTGDGYRDPSDRSVMREEIPSAKLLRRLFGLMAGDSSFVGLCFLHCVPYKARFCR